jgi:hypothetical protein
MIPDSHVNRTVTSWPLLACLLAILAAYAIGIAIFPMLRRGGRISVVTQWIAAPVITALLCAIPAEYVVLRALTALPFIDLTLRIIDFGRQSRAGRTANCNWRHYCGLLVPFPLLLVVFGQKNRRLADRGAWPTELARIACGGTVFALGWLCLCLAQRCSVLRSSFWLDHAVKLVVWVIALEFAAQAAAGLERLLGYNTTPPINRTFISRTPAEFWTRWNQRVYGWLYVNVFLASGGNRAPVRGIVATFFVSAVLHEVMFDIATSRVDGYQATFFLMQIPAVLVSRPLERWARRGSPVGVLFAHAATMGWFAASSVFFFHGIERIFPFYYTAEPWLP